MEFLSRAERAFVTSAVALADGNPFEHEFVAHQADALGEQYVKTADVWHADVRKDDVEGLDVGVDVRDDGDIHELGILLTDANRRVSGCRAASSSSDADRSRTV